jgi:hypothetical protein
MRDQVSSLEKFGLSAAAVMKDMPCDSLEGQHNIKIKIVFLIV